MLEQDFHSIRNPLYLDPNTHEVIFPKGEYVNSSHTEWFKNIGVPLTNTVRGYYYKTNNFGEYLMLYWNDFEIPDIGIKTIIHIFERFPNIHWIGLGCIKGEVGEIWEPKLIINKNKYEK